MLGQIKLSNTDTIVDASVNDSPSSQTSQGIVCNVSTTPSYVLEVLDVPTDCSAESIIMMIKEQLPDVNVLKVDRSAMVKFTRHKEVT